MWRQRLTIWRALRTVQFTRLIWTAPPTLPLFLPSTTVYTPLKLLFFVMVDSVQTIKTTFTDHVDLSEIANNRNVNGMALTYSFGKYPSDGITFALAVAKTRANDDATRSTLLEEISQAFGAVNDTDDVSPSLWSDGRPNYQRLPLNDQIVLRMLYDPLLYSGMNRASAMAIARQRLPGLIEAAQENGETALYQR